MDSQGQRSPQRMRIVTLSAAEVRFRVPEDWNGSVTGVNQMRFLTPAGGEFSAVVREMRKPPLPGFAGPTSIEMVTAITHEFGAVARSLSQATAFASHPVTLAEEGGIVCQVWHLANQVAPWYHQVIIFIYKPPAGCQPEPEVVALLDEELAKCEFLMAAAPGLPATQEIPSRQAKPWWKFW